MAADRWVLVAFLLISAVRGGVSLLPTFPAFLTAIQMNEPERFFFLCLSLACVCMCVHLRGQTGVIPPLACIPSLSPSRPCTQPYYWSKLGPADSVTGRPSTHHTGCQVGRRRQIKQIKGRSERGNRYGTKGEKVLVEGARKREKCCRKKERK